MVRVYRSTVVDAPVEEVWQLLRDFNAHDQWHPIVAESVIEDGRRADEIGCVRRFSLRDGGEIREQLLRLSDRERSFTYCILEAPLPLIGYVATVRLKPVTDGGGTLWEWFSSFSTPPEQEAALTALVGQQVYEAGFAAAKQHLRHPAAARDQARPPGARRAAAGIAAPGQAIACNAVVLREHGGPEALRWESVTVPPPGRGEVRLRHTAIGLNYIDVYARTGYYRLVEPPGVLGMEGAGTVLDIGEGVQGIMPGDRVGYACLPPGAYAEVRTMPADRLVVLPDFVDDETAAAGLLKGMTAEFLLHRVHQVKEGDAVLVHAAAGGVGLLLCQWARHLGATVIGTVGTEAKARLARENGCAYPVVSEAGDFVGQVLEITGGRGADVVYDAVGRDTFLRSYQALAQRGHLVSYGQASGPIQPIDIAAFAGKSATVSRPSFGHYTGTPQQVRAITDRLFDAIEKGVVRVRVQQRYPLREVAQAHRDLEARRTTGSTVLLP
jgi:NADPH:quinone reductase